MDVPLRGPEEGRKCPRWVGPVSITACVVLISLLVLFIILYFRQKRLTKEIEEKEAVCPPTVCPAPPVVKQPLRGCRRYFRNRLRSHLNQQEDIATAIKGAVHDVIDLGQCQPCNKDDPKDISMTNIKCEPYATILRPFV
jgi:hypothetical protein